MANTFCRVPHVLEVGYDGRRGHQETVTRCDWLVQQKSPSHQISDFFFQSINFLILALGILTDSARWVLDGDQGVDDQILDEKLHFKQLFSNLGQGTIKKNFRHLRTPLPPNRQHMVRV